MLQNQKPHWIFNAIVVALLVAMPGFSQEKEQLVCLTVKEAADASIDVFKLRETFIPAHTSGPGVCAFPNRGEEVRDAWLDLIHAIVDHLQTELDEDLVGQRFFSVFCFDEDGKIVEVLHECSDPSMSEAFCPFIADFAQKYRFPVPSEIPFSQCGTWQIQSRE